MSRARVAVALAVLAALCLVATAWVAVATYLRGDAASPHSTTRVVSDPTTGATFEVPRAGWRVRGAGARISYGAVSLVGAAVYRPGYCPADPRGSFRAVAGVTDRDFDAWVRAVGGATPAAVSRERSRLADGTPATLRGAVLRLPADACSSGRVEITMAEADGVRLVVLADAGEPGTLGRAAAERIARSLQLP